MPIVRTRTRANQRKCNRPTTYHHLGKRNGGEHTNTARSGRKLGSKCSNETRGRAEYTEKREKWKCITSGHGNREWRTNSPTLLRSAEHAIDRCVTRKAKSIANLPE